MNKKIKSIKVKVITFLVPILLIAFIVLSGLGYKFASNSLKESNLNIMSEMTKTAAARADDQIQSEIKSLEVIASNPAVSNENISLEDRMEILKPALKTIKQLDISISDQNGNSIDSNGNEKNIKTTQSFMKSIKGENSITNPYVDPNTKKKVISYSVPIKNSLGSIIGIIATVKDCMDFSSVNNEISFLKTGSSLIVDSNGNFIVAEDESLVSDNKNITNMTSDKGSLSELNNIGKSMILGSKSGMGKYMYEGSEKYITYSPIGTTGLSIGITVDEKDLLNALNSLAVVDAVVTIIMILSISCIIIWFTIKVINRLFVAKTYVDNIANGDFYSQVDGKYLKANDEISSICISVSQAKASVGNMIKSVKDNASVVRNGSVSLSEIAEKLSTLTEEISASIGEVSINTNKQSLDFEQITNKLSNLGQEINMSKDSIHSINQDVIVINNKSLKGTKDIEKLNDGITSVNDSFDKFAINIEYIQADMKNVNEITNIINGISEQINLLAFNAAIEAASAGEAGRGFNVIASEVRKLSDKSKESSQSIYIIIKRLMSIINKLVEESKNMDSKLEVQKDIIYNTSSSFTEIAELVKEITPKVSGIENVLVDISYNKDLIVDTVCKLAEEIKNTSNSLEQVNDSSVELARAAEKVNNSSDVLLDKADELIEKVRQFRIEQEEFNDEVSLNTEELNLNESQYIETLDVIAEEEIRESVVNLEYAVDEEIALDLLLEENLVDSNPSLLKKLEVGVTIESFREGHSNVTDVKDYTKLEKQKDYEDLNEYNVI